MENKRSVTILMAEDDDDDYFLTKKVLEKNAIIHQLYRVQDGEELLSFLFGTGTFAEGRKPAIPNLILLDLNMPKKTGYEVLNKIRSHPHFKAIPIVVLTTSHFESDILKAYALGANAYVSKPVSLEEFMRVIRDVVYYWCEVASLPVLLNGR